MTLLHRFALAATLCVALLATAPSAQALNPEQALTGTTTSRWYSGSLIQQYGLNCSILGGSYSEVMTGGNGGYGGTQGVVGVGDSFWASLLLSVPGNPCGPGSAGLQTDLFLPPGIVLDTTRQVRCFYLPRNNSDVVNGWTDGTNEGWSLQGVGSGRLCPDSVGPSTLSAGGLQIGYRLVPSGVLFQIFVPVRATAAVSGAALDWQVASSAAYENPALTRTSAYVFQGAGGGGGPQVFFSRTPSAEAFWQGEAPEAQRSRVEFFANVATTGLAGQVWYEIKRTDTGAVVWSSDPGRPGGPNELPISIGAGQQVVQIVPNPALPEATRKLVTGPNGGFAPVAFDPPGTPGNAAGEWNVPMQVIWTFKPGGGAAVSGPPQPFRTLAGPDRDGDGVPDSSDACPDAKGGGANGCTPVQTTADSDLDGVTGAADACPTVAAAGTANGCPAAAAEPQAPPATGGGSGGSGAAIPAPPLLTAKPGASLKRSGLAGKKGASVTVSCTPGAALTATVLATKATAKKLKLKSGPLPQLAGGKATCTAGQTKLTLKALKPRASALRRAKGKLSATLMLSASGAGGTTNVSVSVKLT